MFMKHTLTYLLLTASVITALWAGGCKTVTEQEASVVPTPENNGAVCHITSVKGTFGTDSIVPLPHSAQQPFFMVLQVPGHPVRTKTIIALP